MKFPRSLVLCSSSNENRTEDDIDLMGHRLSTEILEFVSEYCPGDVMDKISFIGHSLGGIITRAAL